MRRYYQNSQKKRQADMPKDKMQPRPLGTRLAALGRPLTKCLPQLYLFATIFCATLIAYLPALQGSLLWDDDSHVTRLDLRSLHGLWRIWFHPGATQQYYPLLHSAFWIEHRLWGDAVLGYHLVNVALHAMAACLVIAIARRLELPGARLAGFVFALHPVCVEAVAWISEQKSTLSAVFYLGSALVYLGFDQTRRRSQYLSAAGLFVLALMTKTVTATLPAALLVVLWWRRGRLEWKRDAVPLLPWFAIGGPAGILTAWIERTSIGAQGPDFALTVVQRILLAGRATWFYMGKVLWPAGLCFTYPRWTLDAGDWRQYLFPAAAFVLLLGLTLAARRRRGPLAGFLFFAGTLFPVLGFLNIYPFLFSYAADHFQYLASLGIIVPAACAMTMATRRIPWNARSATASASILLLALGTLTWRQAGVYRDAETLYRTVLARNPASWMAHNNLCFTLLRKPGRLEEAIAHCEAALHLRPEYAEAHNNLGSALAQMPGRLPDAVAQFQAALQVKPGFAEAHFDLGNAFSQMPGRLSDAVSEYRAALRIRPEFVEAHLNLGTVLARMPDGLPDAIAEYQAALRIDPHLAEAHNNLGSALARMPGGLPEAVTEFRAALRIDPGYAKAHNNLGSLLAQSPARLPEAIDEFRAALRTNPEYGEAHYNLGVVLAKAGRLPDAIAQFEEALRIDPRSAKAHYNLAVVLSRAGRFQDAIAQFEASLEISPDPDLRRVVDALRAAHK